MNNIDRLIRLNIEMEGLLRTLQVRDDAYVQTLLVDKLEEFTNLIRDDKVKSPASNQVSMPSAETVSSEPVISSAVAEQIHSDSLVAAPDPVALPPEPQIVNDIACLSRSVDLSRAFSVNDKFRFIREIFDGEATVFNNAVSTISSFNTLDQAYDYIFNELQLDPENESVGEFTAVVANHFNAI